MIVFRFMLIYLLMYAGVHQQAFAQSELATPLRIKSSLQWKPWYDQTPDVKSYVTGFARYLPDLIGEGRDLFVLAPDLDNDKQTDIVLYFANPDECGTDGCLYLLLYSKTKLARAFTAYDFKITSEGIKIDNVLIGGSDAK